MNIEEVAEANPGDIHSEPIDPAIGFMPFQHRRLAASLGLELNQAPGRVTSHGCALPYLCRQRLHPGGNQPFGGHRRQSIGGPGRQNQPWKTIRCFDTLSCAIFGTALRRMSWRRGPPTWTFPTSIWMVTWDAWSTAPDWPWRPWTRQLMLVPRRPTSWTLAAEPVTKRLQVRWRSSCPTRRLNGY